MKRTGSVGGEDKHQRRSSARSNINKSEPSFAKGDSVIVYLLSGRKAKGTISGESSGGRYDVTLENGEVEESVYPEDLELSPAARRQGHNETPRHSSGAQRHDSVRSRRPSRDRATDDHVPESRSDAPRRRLPSADIASPSSGNAKETQAGRRPVSPLSSEASVSGSGGSQPAGQPPEAVVTHSPDTAQVGEALTPVASHSDAGTISNSINTTVNNNNDDGGERASESGSSPVTSKIRQQTRGLLKTVRP